MMNMIKLMTSDQWGRDRLFEKLDLDTNRLLFVHENLGFSFHQIP